MDSCFGSNNVSEIDRDTDWKRQKEIDDEEDRQIQQEIQAIMDREQKETEEGLNIFYEAIGNPSNGIFCPFRAPYDAEALARAGTLAGQTEVPDLTLAGLES